MLDLINGIAEWLRGLLVSWGASAGLITFIMAILGVLGISIAVLVIDIFLVWLERKIVARFQDRLGPNRLGPFGLIQPFADVIKLLIKEDITPFGADRVLFNIAPVLALATVLILWAVIPLQSTLVGADLNVGVLYIIAAGAIGTLGIFMAGWASNNKFSLLGAFRMVAMTVSYEVPMVITLLVPVILSGSMSLNAIVNNQAVWNIVVAPVAALIFLVSVVAELGRSPFDLAEAESELVAGYHIEYSGMKFGMFYAGELLHSLTMGALFATLFLGGWRGPGAQQFPILGIFYLFLKSIFFYWVLGWIKYSLPRFRIDFVMNFNWKFLTPLALALVLITAVMDNLLRSQGALLYTLGMLAANLFVVWITGLLLNKYARIERQKVAEVQPPASPELSKATHG